MFNNELNNRLPGGGGGISSSNQNELEDEGIGSVPESIRPLVIKAFVSSFRAAYRVVIVTGAFTLFSALLMENTKPTSNHFGKRGKSEEKSEEKESK